MTEELSLRENERLDDLQNGYFIIQNKENFCFGMDAVLLADFAKVKPGEKVLDMCTGNGIVPILLAAKCQESKIAEGGSGVAKTDLAGSGAERSGSAECRAARSGEVEGEAVKRGAMSGEEAKCSVVGNRAARSVEVEGEAVKRGAMSGEEAKHGVVENRAARSGEVESEAVKRGAMSGEEAKCSVVESRAARSVEVESEAVKRGAMSGEEAKHGVVENRNAKGKLAGNKFVGLEIQEESAEMARRSVAYNHLEDKVEIVTGDIKEASARFGNASFSVVTCNPPYMTGQHGLTNANMPKTIARHEVLCTLEDVIAQAAKVLEPRGRFYMVHRPFRLAEIMSLMVKPKLEPKRMRLVHPYVDKEPNMVLIEGLSGGNSRITVEEPLIVYDRPRVYTQEILDIYGVESKK